MPHPPHLTTSIELTILQVLFVDSATHSVFKTISKQKENLERTAGITKFAEINIEPCVRYFHQIFICSPNYSPSKTMKNAFYFI